MRCLLTLSIVVLALAIPYATDAAPEFSFSAFDVPGAYETDPFAINSSGQIVGTVYDNFYCDDYGCYGASPHGFLWDSGTVTRIDVPAPPSPGPPASTAPARSSDRSGIPLPGTTGFSRTGTRSGR